MNSPSSPAAEAANVPQPPPAASPVPSSAPDRRHSWGLAMALAGAIGFSGKAILAKLMYRHGVDAVTVVMWRMLLALPLFLLMAWWGSRGKPPLARRDWAMVGLLGFTGYYLASMLDFMGLEYISASLERLILYLNPTIVLLLSVLIFKKRVTAWQLLALAISYAGVLLVFSHEIGFQGPGVVVGSLLVFASAVSYAIYLVYSGEMVKKLGSLRLVGLASTVASLLCIAHFFIARPVAAMWVPEPVLWLSLLNATACTVAPVLLVMMAVERVGPTMTAQTGMVGPLSTLTMGAILLGEPFTLWIAAGTVLVLAGIYLLAKWRH